MVLKMIKKKLKKNFKKRVIEILKRLTCRHSLRSNFYFFMYKNDLLVRFE